MDRELPKNTKEISLAIIDSFYELFTGKNSFLDIELFEIQLIKYGLDLNDNIREFFKDFISKNKTQEDINYFSKILSYGVKNKYKYFNEKLENLKSLYDIIFWIETHTEFTSLKYIDEVFDKNIEHFYKFILFYTFRKDTPEEIYDFETENIEHFMDENKSDDNNLVVLELLFQYLERTDLIIKNFINLSRDREYFKFIVIQKKLSGNDTIKKIISACDTDEYIFFLLYLITFNPYIVIDDFKISIFNKDNRSFYLFFKAILYRFKYYKISQRSPYELSLFLKYIFGNKNLKEIKDLLYLINAEDVILFEPLILFVLGIQNNEYPVLLLFKTIKASISDNDFIINYNLLYSIIESIINKKMENLIFTVFLGNFKEYLTSNKKFEPNEVKNFFMTINLFLTKTTLSDDIKERLFKMNLKFFEKYIKNKSILNPMLLTISKHYTLILNKYLKEYNEVNDINVFILEIKNIIFNDNRLIIPEIKEPDKIDPEDISFTFISDEIKKILINEFNKNNKKIKLPSVSETEGYFLSGNYFNLLVLLKILLLYDIFYPLFYKLQPKKLKVQKDKEYIFLLDENNIVNKYDVKSFLVKKINFYYHFVNKIYSIIIITVFSLLGFRMIIDAFIVNNKKLLFLGFLLIIISLLIDYFLFFFYRKFNNLYFFKVKIKDKNYIFYSEKNTLPGVVAK